MHRSCEPNACLKARASVVWRELNRGRVGVILSHRCAVVVLFWFQWIEVLWQIMNEQEASVPPNALLYCFGVRSGGGRLALFQCSKKTQWAP